MATITNVTTQSLKQADAEGEYTFSSSSLRKKKGSRKLRNKKFITKEEAGSRRGPLNKQLSRSLSTPAILSTSTVKSRPTPNNVLGRIAPSASTSALKVPRSLTPKSSSTGTANAVFTISGSPIGKDRNVFSSAMNKDRNIFSSSKKKSKERHEFELELAAGNTKKPWETDIRKKHKTEFGDLILRDGPSSGVGGGGGVVVPSRGISKTRSLRRCRSLSVSATRQRSLSTRRLFDEKQRQSSVYSSGSDDDHSGEELDDAKISDEDKTYEKYRQFLSSTKSNDSNEESLSRQSVMSLKHKVGAAPSLNFSYRYSAAADELLGLGTEDYGVGNNPVEIEKLKTNTEPKTDDLEPEVPATGIEDARTAAATATATATVDPEILVDVLHSLDASNNSDSEESQCKGQDASPVVDTSNNTNNGESQCKVKDILPALDASNISDSEESLCKVQNELPVVDVSNNSDSGEKLCKVQDTLLMVDASNNSNSEESQCKVQDTSLLVDASSNSDSGESQCKVQDTSLLVDVSNNIDSGESQYKVQDMLIMVDTYNHSDSRESQCKVGDILPAVNSCNNSDSEESQCKVEDTSLMVDASNNSDSEESQCKVEDTLPAVDSCNNSDSEESQWKVEDASLMVDASNNSDSNDSQCKVEDTLPAVDSCNNSDSKERQCKVKDTLSAVDSCNNSDSEESQCTVEDTLAAVDTCNISDSGESQCTVDDTLPAVDACNISDSGESQRNVQDLSPGFELEEKSQFVKLDESFPLPSPSLFSSPHPPSLTHSSPPTTNSPTSTEEGMLPPLIQQTQQQKEKEITPDPVLLSNDNKPLYEEELSRCSETDSDKINGDDGRLSDEVAKTASIITSEEEGGSPILGEGNRSTNDAHHDDFEDNLGNPCLGSCSQQKDDGGCPGGESKATNEGVDLRQENESYSDENHDHASNSENKELLKIDQNEPTALATPVRSRVSSFDSKEKYPIQGHVKEDFHHVGVDDTGSIITYNDVSTITMTCDDSGGENSSFREDEEDPDYPEEDRNLLSLLYHIHTS